MDLRFQFSKLLKTMVYEKRLLEELSSRVYAEKKSDRERSRKWDKKQNVVTNEPDTTNHSFYCVKCRVDYLSVGVKRVSGSLAWFMSLHECGREAIRRITDKSNDEYYDLSEEIKRERQKYKDDTLAPFQNRFRQLYGETEVTTLEK